MKCPNCQHDMTIPSHGDMPEKPIHWCLNCGTIADGNRYVVPVLALPRPDDIIPTERFRPGETARD